MGLVNILGFGVTGDRGKLQGAGEDIGVWGDRRQETGGNCRGLMKILGFGVTGDRRQTGRNCIMRSCTF